MIRNHEVIKNKFECGKRVADYIMRLGIPLLSVEDNRYYFRESEELKETLNKVPLIIRLMDKIF